jgi:uroporphyrinogen decarboxylase
MTGRERVLKAVAFEETDRVPMDLSGMMSTGISCFAYPALAVELGLPPRPPRVCDTGQMLALPDLDVIDALDIDVVVVLGDVTNAFDQPEKWHAYDFNGRLPAMVRKPESFEAQPDGTILQNGGACKMPPAAHVFESEHAGQPINLTGDIPRPDLDQMKRDMATRALTDEDVARMKAICKRARESSDRAVFFNGPGAGLSIAGYGGMAVFPLLCLIDPDFVSELHDIVTAHQVTQIEKVLAEVGPYIDVYMCGSDDWGTQDQTIASPDVYRDLFMPYYRRVNDAIHAAAPEVKTFLHSCGAIYDILDYVVDSNFDIVNPVQWMAGGHSYKEWKDKSRNRIALWGGGVNTQATLPLGTVEDVEREVAEVVEYMRQDGGFVFCAIHNILAEIPADKVVAMYRTAASVGKAG